MFYTSLLLLFGARLVSHASIVGNSFLIIGFLYLTVLNDKKNSDCYQVASALCSITYEGVATAFVRIKGS
jgi:hypothetical protein